MVLAVDLRGGNHWSLFMADMRRRCVIYVDPLGKNWAPV